MAYPTVEDVTETQFSSSTTAHAVAMPATVNAGDLLLIVIAFGAANANPWDGNSLGTGWSDFLVSGDTPGVGYDISDTAPGVGHFFVKDAVGDEDGTTVDVVTTGNASGAAQVYRISGWDDSGAITAALEMAKNSPGSGSTIDPPSLTAPWGSVANLWIAVGMAIDDDATASSYPTNYTNGVDTVSGAGTNAGAEVYSAQRNLTSATDNPGTFSISESEGTSGFTIVVKPPTTVALSGTATATIDEDDITAGAKIVDATLTDGVWVADGAVSPLIEAGDVTVSGSNTASSSWAVSRPAYAAGDLIIINIAWDDSTTTTDATEPSGPNSETLNEINATPITDSGTAIRQKTWWYVAAGAQGSSGTLTFTPSASEQWNAHVVVVPTGEFDASDPIGSISSDASTVATDAGADTPAWTTDADDADGLIVCFVGVDADPLGTIASGWSVIASNDRGAVASGIATRDALAANSTSVTSVVWDFTGSNVDQWTSQAFVIHPADATTFTDARQDFIDAYTAAASPTNGWNNEVRAKAAVTEVTRVSDTVVRFTIAAQAGYDISSTETITGLFPNTLIEGYSGSSLTATPTFTIDAAGGVATIVMAAVAGVATVTNLVVASPVSVLLDAVAGVAAVTNLAVASPAALALGQIDGVAAVTNLVVASPAVLALDAVAGTSSLPNVILESPALLALSQVDGVGALPNVILESPSILALSQVDGVGDLPNVILESPSTLALSAAAGVAAVTNMVVASPAPVLLDAIAGLSSLDNMVVGTSTIALQSVAGVASADNMLVGAPSLVALSAVAGVAAPSNMVVASPAAVLLDAVAGVGALPNMALASPVTVLLDAVAGVGALTNVTVNTPSGFIVLQQIDGVATASNMTIDTPAAAGGRRLPVLKIGGGR